MAWIVDTSLLIDVAENDPTFGLPSATLLEEKLADGLALCPLTYVELAPVFEGQMNLQDEFLESVGVNAAQAWTSVDTKTASVAWNLYLKHRRTQRGTKRPIADILIGAFAARFDGLLTRNVHDFATHFSELTVVGPDLPS